MAKKYKIALVDDHTLFRNGLRGLLGSSDMCEVVLEAASGEEFFAGSATVEFDIVMLDIDMPKMNGFEVATQLLKTNSEAKIITLSMHGDEDYYFKMVSIGVKGFLLKSSDIDEVVNAISIVGDGGSYFSQELLCSLVGSLRSSGSYGPILSEREMEILLLVCQGLSNQEIGDKLFISKRTVDKHRANILDKTGCKNTANLIVYAIKNSLVEI